MTVERRKFISGLVKEGLDLTTWNGHDWYGAFKFKEKITYIIKKKKKQAILFISKGSYFYIY